MNELLKKADEKPTDKKTDQAIEEKDDGEDSKTEEKVITMSLKRYLLYCYRNRKISRKSRPNHSGCLTTR